MRLLLDTDAIIKLAKAGVLEVLTEHTKCAVPMQVNQELLKGKERLYEDAAVVEELARQRKLRILSRTGEKRLDLGMGESALLQLWEDQGADAIISDDRKFLSVPEERGVPFIIPTDVIALLFLKGWMTKDEAIIALERIRPWTREMNYDKARTMIGGK